MIEDFRIAVVSLWRRPQFSLLAILTLTTALFLAVTAFAFLNAVVIGELPYRDVDRIVVLWSSTPQKGISKDWTSYPTLMDWKRASRSLEQFAVQLRIETGVVGGEEPVRVKTGRVSADLFQLLGVNPIRGRAYTADEEDRREAVILISENYWLRHFDGADDVVGKIMELDNKAARIIGVMPRSFEFPSEATDIWAPLGYVENWPAFLAARQSDGFRAFARLKPEVSLEQARSEFEAIANDLAARYPATDRGRAINVTPLRDEVTEPSLRRGLWLLMTAVILVLFVACGHAASLFLARNYGQRRDISVRLALGASVRSLIQQRLAESLVTSLISGVLALGLANISMHGIAAILKGSLPRMNNVQMDLKVILFGLGASIASALFAWFAPAWSLARSNVADVLRGTRNATGQRRQTGQRLLVSVQLAATTLLTVSAALLVVSYTKLQRVSVGFEPEHVLLAPLELPGSSEGRALNAAQYFEGVLDAVRRIQGVDAVGAVSNVFSETVPNNTIVIEGRGAIEVEPNLNSIVAGDYLAALKIPLLQGRWFNDYDRPNSPQVAVINQTMAKRFWPTEFAIGKRFRFGVPGEELGAWVTVAGVARDTLPNGPESQPISHFYLPLGQRAWVGSMEVVVRASMADSTFVEELRRAIRNVNGAAPKFEIERLKGKLDRLGARRQANTFLIVAFSLLSAALTAVGLYALIHFSVMQRTAELGIRMALGATPGDLLRMILWEGISLGVFGIAVGLAGAVALTKLLAGFVHGVGVYEPLLFGGVALLLLVVVVLAAAAPAVSAYRMAPGEALGRE